VVGSQTASLTPGPSFAHNLGDRYPNGQCDAIFIIYASRTFQWHQEHPNARCFGPCCRTLNIWESRRIPSPQLWECWASPPHLAKVGLRHIVCYACTSNWSTIWFFVVYKIYCCSYDASISNCEIVYWWVAFYSCDYNFVITCSYCCNFKSIVGWIFSCCCDLDTSCNCWFDYRSNVIWVWSYCYNSNTCSIWPRWFSCIICSSSCMCSLIFVAIDAYSWKLTSYKIDYTCFKIYSTSSILGLSCPPLRSLSSFKTPILDGLAPSVSPLFSPSS